MVFHRIRLTAGISGEQREPAACDAMDSSGVPDRHQSSKASDALRSTREKESVEKQATIAMDIAKNVFEVAVSEEPGRVKECDGSRGARCRGSSRTANRRES